MAKVRELTEPEKFYIDNHNSLSDKDIASKMAGIGVKTVSKYRVDNPPTVAESLPVVEINREIPEEEARQNKLAALAAATGSPTGDLMGHREEQGIVVMTEAASEMADARKVVRGRKVSEQEKIRTNRSRITKIRHDKPMR